MAEQTERVAIITVHGVADQRPGQTVDELARLLCHGDSDAARYVEGEKHEIIIPVRPLSPLAGTSGSDVPAETDGALQFQPGRPSNFFLARRDAALGVAKSSDADLGVALTDHLLSSYRPAERDALYESTRIALRRQADAMPVDLYELYWADYSRLRPGGVRAVSAMYQLFFHLSTLARDVVDQVALATGRGGPLRALQWLHAWSAWLQKGPAAVLQLMMLLLVAFGATAFTTEEQQILILTLGGGVTAIVLAALALVAELRSTGAASRMRAVSPWALGAFVSATIAGVCIAVPNYVAEVYFFTAALLTIVLGALLLWRYSRTVRGVRLIGHVALLSVAALLLWTAIRAREGVSTLYEWMLTTALNTSEYLLFALLFAWGLLVVVQIAALLLGFWLGRAGDPDVGASLATARIGMVVSTALFAVLSLVLWSVISYVAGLAFEDFEFMPVVFIRAYMPPGHFFDLQVTDVGALFTPLMALISVIGGGVLVALAPSLREEIAPGDDEQSAVWTMRLGRWWTRARRSLGFVFGGVIPWLSIGGGVVYLLFVEQKLFGVEHAFDRFGEWHGDVLVTIGQWLAGGAVTITALGARFTQTFGKLRVALDAALDIDNYFQDPPNGLPPRARIFSRFVSLLDAVRQRGYTRVVIVSHSQGTVISADLMRYLNVTGRLHDHIGAMPLSLITLGSPLRDLYATLFPFLYRWMGPPPLSRAAAAPQVADLALAQWINAYRAGDYVGRSIWTAQTEPTMLRVATVTGDALVAVQQDRGRTEFCLGAGAHTHYFDNDAIALAIAIDGLVQGRTND